MPRGKFFLVPGWCNLTVKTIKMIIPRSEYGRIGSLAQTLLACCTRSPFVGITTVRSQLFCQPAPRLEPIAMHPVPELRDGTVVHAYLGPALHDGATRRSGVARGVVARATLLRACAAGESEWTQFQFPLHPT